MLSESNLIKSEDSAPYGNTLPEKPDLIQQLEAYRLENKISQEELAKQLDVAFSTVNRWLNGKAKPNKIQSYHIEKLLKVKNAQEDS